MKRPEHQDLFGRVELTEDEVPPFGPGDFDHAYAAVEVRLEDGSVVRRRCDVPRGDARMPLGDADLEAKFRDCIEFAGSGWDPDELLQKLRSLEGASRVSDALSFGAALA